MFNVKLLAIPFFISSITTIILCVIEIRKYKNPAVVHKEYREATKEMIGLTVKQMKETLRTLWMIRKEFEK